MVFVSTGWSCLPPDEQAQQGRQETAMDEVDAVMHLGAARTREGLAHAE